MKVFPGTHDKLGSYAARFVCMDFVLNSSPPPHPLYQRVSFIASQSIATYLTLLPSKSLSTLLLPSSISSPPISLPSCLPLALPCSIPASFPTCLLACLPICLSTCMSTFLSPNNAFLFPNTCLLACLTLSSPPCLAFYPHIFFPIS